MERVTEPEPGATYPRLLKAEGRCPPEDVGGPWGYDHFLEVMAYPGHEELLEWHAGPFDPQDAEPERITRDFERLAKRWIAKPRKPTPPS